MTVMPPIDFTPIHRDTFAMMKVAVQPEMFEWACNRAGAETHRLDTRFPRLDAWRQGTAQPTLKQLEDFARATHAPIGYFFLPSPPEERLPIPDCRTLGNAYLDRPSPDLQDTLSICLQRQEWYRDHCRLLGEPPLPFVGSARLGDDCVRLADRIRATLGFDLEERRHIPTWTDALRRFIEMADEAGILVMVNGVVGSNNRRKLDPAEFRGFALTDPFAPLVFLNGADSKAAQMFTLAHELAHLWYGQSALTDAGTTDYATSDLEVNCNRVAAELLVPMEALRLEYRPNHPVHEEAARLARRFKVSTLVVLRRIYDAGGLTRDQFLAASKAELERLAPLRRTSGGGDFYATTAARCGKRFARAVVSSTWEGRASFTEAARLLGFRNMNTLRELGVSLGVLV